MSTHEDSLTHPDTCEVCRNDFQFGGWCIRHGMCVCAHCGTTYMVVGDDAPYCTLREGWKRLVRDYHQETDHAAVIEASDGTTDEAARRFEEWFERHKDEYAL